MNDKRSLMLLISIIMLAILMVSSCSSEEDQGDVKLGPGYLVINEVMPKSDDGQASWVELANQGGSDTTLAGLFLTDKDGNSYTIPDGTPDLPQGAFVIILFDGLGSEEDESKVKDGRIHLHSTPTMVDPFEDTGDQLGLYETDAATAENMLDFVAWGEPAGEDDDEAVSASLWFDETYVVSERGGTVTGLSQSGESIGLYPDRTRGLVSSWGRYASFETTQGEGNNIPTTEVMLPSSGSSVLGQDFYVSWYNVPHAVEYKLQMDDNADFSSPEVDLILSEPYYVPSQPPADGTYFWRIKAFDAEGYESQYSDVAIISVATLEPLVLPSEPIEGEGQFSARATSTGNGTHSNVSYSLLNSPTAQSSYWEVDYLNNIPPLLQRKDSNLICWDGDKELGSREPWDGPHNDTPGNHADHGRNYCVRASIAMINHYYGGDLTQDRITYEHWGGDGWPVGDLGHNVPTLNTVARDLMSWALKDTPVTMSRGKPTFNQIKGWIDDGKGVMVWVPGHAIVLRGWAIYNGTHPDIPAGTRYVIYNDPWDARMHVVQYESINLIFYFVPDGTPTGREQESSVKEDPDNDSIMTFDERRRFNTNPENDDTDDDCIKDQLDMHSFIYTNHDVYSPSFADWDGDGLHKQVDPDNDNGSVIDGNEDADWDGHKNDDETDNFVPGDDGVSGGFCRPIPTPTPTSVTAPQTPVGPVSPPTGEVNILVGFDVIFDPSFHEPHVGMPDSMMLSFDWSTSTFGGEHPWVDVVVDIAEDGSFTGNSIGTVAGFSDVSIAFAGTFDGENLAGEYSMGVNGELPGGDAITYSVEGEAAGSGEETPVPTESAAEEFYDAFNAAMAAGDAGALVDMLHPAVIELYGLEACQAYLASIIDTTVSVEVVQEIGFGPWLWEIDGTSTLIEDVYTLAINVTAQGETRAIESHVGLLDDGSLGWFTDCGEPLE
ncbi:MAG: hypothetical protein GTO18_16880 [Anaerolineales bacterium]|nr:hypothetical protein [Anaerolineales bacterium]